ncbi:MAG: tetratricopeptide repeat protein [Chloroflexi bacterium]|nr:tetratricopeptide repeat protein [Chloroflexota bacterium]
MRLRTLGGLALQDSTFGRSKPLLLLAYVCLEGPVSKRELADLFFMHTKDPRDSLATALGLLRREPGKLIEADGERVIAGVDCDAVDLVASLDAGEHERAAAGYGGPFVKGIDVALGTELEQWVYGTREVLAGRVRHAHLRLAEVEASVGDFVGAARRAETAFFLPGAPEPEPELYERMHALMVVGDSPRATEVRREAETFGLTLTTTPSEVRARFAQGGAAEALPAPGTLSLRGTSFVGRDVELLEVANLLAAPDCRLLTLHGMGGIGKSRLAHQAARDQLSGNQFSDGVYLVPLAGLSAPSLVPRAIAEALRMDERDASLPQIIQFLGQKHVLIVFDTFEHLMVAAEVPVSLLAGCPNLKLLVTSRERLNLEAEWVINLDGLPIPPPSVRTVDDALLFDALNLFSQRAKRSRLSFSITPENLMDALRICRLVEGSPLGLELAAVWVRLLPLSEIADEIQGGLDVLTSANRDTEEQHRSIRAAFEHSWRLLSSVEQRAVARLSVFHGGFSRRGAAAVAGATLPLLASLVDKALLRVTASGRYGRHALLLQFSREQLAADEAQMLEAQSAHIEFFLHLVERCNERARNGLHKDALAELDLEYGNIVQAARSAQSVSRTQDLVRFMRLLAIEGPYTTARGYDADLHVLLEAAIEAASQADDLATVHALLGRLADMLQNLVGDFDAAFDGYRRARDLARQAGQHDREAIYLSNMGVVRSRLRRNDAQEYLSQAYDLANAQADDLSLAIVLEQWGFVVGAEGDWPRAQARFRESLVVLDRLELLETIPRAELVRRRFFAMINLGDAERNLGNYEEALESCDGALAIAEHLDSKIWQAQAHHNAGEIYHDVGDREKAREHLEQAHRLYTESHAAPYVEQLSSYLRDEGYVKDGGGAR